MLPIELVQTVQVIFEAGGIRYLPEILANVGGKRPLLLCDPGIEKAGLLAQVEEVLHAAQIPFAVFARVSPDPKATMVAEAYRFCTEERCDAVVGLGGGSVIDTAKAVNLLLHNGGQILDYVTAPPKDSPGLIVLPTTAGTGSELSDGLIISGDDGTKIPILAPNAGCDYALLDPCLMLGLPPQLTASTGMDVLAHAMEAYTSTCANPVSDLICEKIIETVLTFLPIAVQDGSNLEARSKMAIASTMAGWMLRYGHTHAGHSIAHVLGAAFHIPHGFACAYALPEILAYNVPAVPEKTLHLGNILHCTGLQPETAGAQVRDALLAFRFALGLRPAESFWQPGIPLADLAQAVVHEPFQGFNPRKMDIQDACVLLKNIFEKKEWN